MKLRAPPPRLRALPDRISTHATAGTGFARTDGKSTTERGYGHDWQELRARILQAEPWCREHARSGERVPATHVDHIERFHGLNDPRRLDPRNLRPLCQPCHMRRTARQSMRRDEG